MNRRGFLTLLAATSCGAAVAEAPVATKDAAERIRGRVSLDGRKDASGIIVTNGRDCTLTDAKGDYSLPVYAGMRFVTVTVPSGYRDAWPSIPYPSKSGYNFWMSRWEPSARKGCSFVHIADSEISGVSALEKKWARHVRQVADREDAAFIVHTGDICRRRGDSRVGCRNRTGSPEADDRHPLSRRSRV